MAKFVGVRILNVVTGAYVCVRVRACACELSLSPPPSFLPPSTLPLFFSLATPCFSISLFVYPAPPTLAT